MTDRPQIQQDFDELLEKVNSVIGDLEKCSDRVIAIVGGAILEGALGMILLHKSASISDDERKSINNGTGRYVDYSRRVSLAKRDRLISKNVKNNLMILGQIRNRFAHNIIEETFDCSDIKGLCSKLKIIDEFNLKREISSFPLGKNADFEEIKTDAFKMVLTDEDGYQIAILKNRLNKSSINRNNFLNSLESLWIYLIIVRFI